MARNLGAEIAGKHYAVREAVAVGGSDRHFPRDSWMPKARSN